MRTTLTHSEAWSRHVANWQPPNDAGIYVPARELNEREEVIRTVSEGHYNDNYVDLLCREQFRVWSGLPPMEEFVGHVYWGTMSNEARSSYHCQAIDRYEGEGGETLYTAEILQRECVDGLCYEWVSEVLLAVPRDVFFFVDKPYTRE